MPIINLLSHIVNILKSTIIIVFLYFICSANLVLGNTNDTASEDVALNESPMTTDITTDFHPEAQKLGLNEPYHSTRYLSNWNCLGQFRGIPWNRASDVHRASTLIRICLCYNT